MIKASAQGKDGPVLFLGLSDENIQRLRAGQPILTNAKELGLPDMAIVIVAGATNADIIAMIEEHLPITAAPEIPPDEHLVEQIIRDILKHENAAYNLSDRYDRSSGLASAEFRGQVYGLRLALCRLYGWNRKEADHEGKADQLVREYAERQMDQRGPT